MFRALSLVCLLAITLSGCASPPSSANAAGAASATPARENTAESVGPEIYRCPLSKAVQAQPPDDPNADPFGFGDWYVNADRSIWTGAQSWQVGGNKVLWIRPQGSELQITGRRLDAEAPPLHAIISCCYPTGFQTSGLYFPAAGCWEVIAQAGQSRLRVVAEVAPGSGVIRDEACGSLQEAVRRSDQIVVARVAESEIKGRNAWHEVDVLELFKPAGLMPGYGISVFQDLQAGPLLEKGSQYVLFLQPGDWSLVCAERSLLQVLGQEATPVAADPLWLGGTLAELRAEIDRLLVAP